MASARNLHIDFVGFHHAQFHAGFFFNHFETFFQVMHFGFKLIVGLNGLLIFEKLRSQIGAQLHHIGQTAPPPPQLHVHEHEQGDQQGRDEASAHN